MENKYLRIIKRKMVVGGSLAEIVMPIDVYDVLIAFDVSCPAICHAIKKLLMCGKRGGKDYTQDLEESIQALSRAIEIKKAQRDK